MNPKKIEPALEDERGQFAERETSSAHICVGFQNRTRFVKAVKRIGQCEEVTGEQVRTEVVQDLRDGFRELAEFFGQV